MRRLILLCALALAQGAMARPELQAFGAMVEGPEGTPLASATATGVGNDPLIQLYLTASAVAETDGICLRVWDKGACHPLIPEQGGPVAGLDGLSLVAVKVPNEEIMAKFSAIQLRAQPLVGVLDPTSDGRQVQLLTQSALGGWESPLDPAEVTGQSAQGFTMRSSAINPMSVGAPVVHPQKGLVGVISAAQSGSARVIGMTDVVDAVVAAGFQVPPGIRPKGDAVGELPRQVDNELGRIYVFSDNSSLAAGLSGFYGPSEGLGFDERFVASLDYSVWGVDLGAPSGTLLAKGAKTLPLIRSGMPVEAPFKGTPPDIVATCVVHETPGSQGRRALVMQFWRAVPERYNNQMGSKGYDEAAPPLTGWADGPSPCAGRIARLDAERVAALRGEAVLKMPDATEAEPWHWSLVEVGDGRNVSGTSGGTRVNITCHRLQGRRVVGMAILGDLLQPLAKLDVRSGKLMHRVGGQGFAVGLERSGSMIALKPFRDGEVFLAALALGDEITLEWKDANGLVPLGSIDLTGAAEPLEAQREHCGLSL